MTPLDFDEGAFCRKVESHLCRKNGGHLIRVVGPAFELVCHWARCGIPLRVVCRAIDRTVERYYATGPKRRPLRIEYCEADVVDLHDEWRRAGGVVALSRSAGEAVSRRGPSLLDHVEQCIERLTTWRARGDRPAPVSALAERIVSELVAARGKARGARGAKREELVARLGEVDVELLAALRDNADRSLCARLRKEAEQELYPFRERMPAAAFQRALDAGSDRLLREHFELPTLFFD